MAPAKNFARRSQPFCSPRHIYHRHLRRIQQRHAAAVTIANGQEADTVAEDGLPPGWEKLYSSYIPGLVAGKYEVNAMQTLASPYQNDPPPTLKTKPQTFNVVAPQYQLPPNAIYSVYPPQGHGDLPDILPHVVLNDPTLPWERIGSRNAFDAETKPPDYYVNRVPWLAVFVFTQDELKLPDSALRGVDSIFKNIPALADKAAQSSTYTTAVNVGDASKLLATVSPVKDSSTDLNDDPEAVASLVFLPPPLFKSLFRAYDGKTFEPIANQREPNVDRYRFLSHLRNINVDGMAEASASTGDDDRAFGVVYSHRTGPLHITQPTTVIVHLLSIERVEQMSFSIPADVQFVALPSLFSWTYTCLPPESASVYQEFSNLGETLSFLRPEISSKTQQKLKESSPLGPKVLNRIIDGYTLAKYSVQTGEQTSCFYRGPFAPSNVQSIYDDAWGKSLSNAGSDLQMLDKQMGLMDITYSTAWQIGRTVALTDDAFTTSLARIRRDMYTLAMKYLQYDTLKPLGVIQSVEDLISSLPSTLEKLKNMDNSRGPLSNESLRRRWSRTYEHIPNLAYSSYETQESWEKYLAKAAAWIAGSMNADGSHNERCYDESNTPWSADWKVALSWALDKLWLTSVPSHYLITDPANIPLESLRFFTVDKNWTDSVLDGGLSLANHIDRDKDSVRVAIKKSILRYLQTENSTTGQVPPVPVYGCYLRSALVTKFPDLRVSVLGDEESTTEPILLRHDVVNADTMLCLFSQRPNLRSFSKLRFTQPAHQQTFSAATSLSATQIEMAYKRIYCVENPNDKDHSEPIANITWTKGAVDPDHGLSFIWSEKDPDTGTTLENVNTLFLESWATDLWKTEVEEMTKFDPKWFTEPFATSSLIGIQLNTPCWQLEVELRSLAGAESTTAMTRPKSPELAAVANAGATSPPASRVGVQPTGSSIVSRSAPVPALGTIGRAQHTGVSKVPPHFPRICAVPISMPIAGENPSPGNGAYQNPTISYNFWPAESGGRPSDSKPILMQKLPTDIVFSIVKPDGVPQPRGVHLKRIRIKIPTGPIGKSIIYLTNRYRGPGAEMLSNLRFNVLLRFSTTGDAMEVTVEPRGQNKNGALYEKFDEVSFVLKQVHVNDYGPGRWQALININEEWWNLQDQKFEYNPHMLLVPPRVESELS